MANNQGRIVKEELSGDVIPNQGVLFTYDFHNERIEPHEQTIASSHRTILNDFGEYQIIITDNPTKYPDKQTIIHGGKDFNIVGQLLHLWIHRRKQGYENAKFFLQRMKEDRSIK